MKNLKVMVALSFAQDSYRFELIQNYRARFDFKYHKDLPLYLSLIAPIEINSTQLPTLLETLKEEAESFFYGVDQNQFLNFNNLDFHYTNKHKILYLEPYFDQNWQQFIELLPEIVDGQVLITEKKKKTQSFMTIGRFQNDLACQLAVDVARQEMQLPINLRIKNIQLLVKHQDRWIADYDIVEFLSNQNINQEFMTQKAQTEC